MHFIRVFTCFLAFGWRGVQQEGGRGEVNLPNGSNRRSTEGRRIFVSLWGTFGRAFGDKFLYFLARDFNVISSLGLDSLFDDFVTLWVHHF